MADADSGPTAAAHGTTAVDAVALALQETYGEDGVRSWLRARNRNLGGARPLDLLAAGRLGEVRMEVARLTGEAG